MIRAEADGIEYGVKFGHLQLGPEQQIYSPIPSGKQVRARTFVAVVRQDTMCDVGHGIANCSVGDAFCKETGRKLALTRALRDLPKPVRKAIWEAYFQRDKAS
uniref:Uncharacterized protein n=1 Tax=viral metagenome TaxID=1070528 RepID=A0A6M3IK71_9ZZZZ